MSSLPGTHGGPPPPRFVLFPLTGGLHLPLHSLLSAHCHPPAWHTTSSRKPSLTSLSCLHVPLRPVQGVPPTRAADEDAALGVLIELLLYTGEPQEAWVGAPQRLPGAFCSARESRVRTVQGWPWASCGC